jgi:hypothetical protein
MDPFNVKTVASSPRKLPFLQEREYSRLRKEETMRKGEVLCNPSLSSLSPFSLRNIAQRNEKRATHESHFKTKCHSAVLKEKGG